MRSALATAWIAVALAVGCAGAARPAAPAVGGTVTVYVVRHAEKLAAPAAPKDPPLAERGARRAAALVGAIDLGALVAVYATPFARTRATAAPVAAAAGLPITEYAPEDTAGLAARIRGRVGGAVLVVGHSNTVPAILAALGVAEAVVLGDGDYGDLFVVTLGRGGAAALARARFGD